MKRAVWIPVLAGLAALATSRWAMPSEIPLARLIANAEKRVSGFPKDGEARFLLARLYSLKYAGESDQVGIYDPDTKPHLPRWVKIQVDSPAKHTPGAATALWKSINLYQFAVQFLETDARVHLGQGWMFEEASKWVSAKPISSADEAMLRKLSAPQWRQRAVDAYRKSYELAKTSDAKQEHQWIGLEDMASKEAAQNLLRLSNAKSIELTAAFRSELKGHIADLDKKPSAITPIVFPLSASTPYSAIDNPKAKVKFDLDGSGLGRKWSWITPRAAFLCWNPLGDRRIESARDLFGNATFWMFFRNGYDALAALDDNRDGELASTELRFIGVWRDVNANGLSDPGEVKPLAAYGIERIRVRAQGKRGLVWFHQAGIILRNGKVLPTYDWVAKRQE